MSILSVGMQGIQTGFNLASQAGGQILGVTTGASNGDLATPLVNLQVSEIQVKASADVVKAGDEMLGTLIDIKA